MPRRGQSNIGPRVASTSPDPVGGQIMRPPSEMEFMPFRDRAEAGRKLAAALAAYKGGGAAVLALPRGGVPVAAEIALALGAPLGLMIVRKIGVPYQPELAMGAVVDGAEPIVVRNEDVIALAGVSAAEFEAVRDRELAELERRHRRYLAGGKQPEVSGRVAIVVDDGIATGATMRAALRGLRRRGPKSIVLAVPVAPPETIEALRGEADEIVCLEQHRPFGAIGAFYADFRQLDDTEVIETLARCAGSAARPPESNAN